jgi:hypothetical protein
LEGEKVFSKLIEMILLPLLPERTGHFTQMEKFVGLIKHYEVSNYREKWLD